MTSGEYWEKRAIERALRLERGTLPYIRKLSTLYAKAYRSLREDLDRLFERYAETGDFSPEEAAAYLREPVTPKERKILEDALKGITDEDERRKAVARINSASYRARMDRFRAMQERIRIECAKTAPDVIDTIRQAMERSGREAYYRTIFDNSKAAGVQLPFTDLSLERLEGVINQKIEGKSFSSRVWGNTNAVAQLLTDTLRENVATGRSWRRSVNDMRELLGVDYPGGATYAATRILRTETARVNNELSAEANVENGFDRYRYIAMLDSKTSETCRDHDGGIDPDTHEPYTYKNKKLGVNFPPLHPNCRSTTSAWVNEELLAKITRTARDENGNVYQIPGNMTYREWEKQRGGRGSMDEPTAPTERVPAGGDRDGRKEKPEDPYKDRDIKKRYFQEATPGRGNLDREEGYIEKRHYGEIAFAEWLHRKLGGDIVLLKEAKKSGVKTPDYRWEGALWELKNPTTEKAVDGLLRQGIKQIFNEPGGIILDFQDVEVDHSLVRKIIDERMLRADHLSTADVMIVQKGEILGILRY